LKGTKWDGFLVLLFGFLSSCGIAACLKLWYLDGLESTYSVWLFADAFFLAVIGVTGYVVCLVRFVNYLRER
jgi:hypothetical protein